MVLSLQSFDDDKDNGDDDFDDDFFKHSFFFHISIVFKIRLQKYAQKIVSTNKKGNLNTKLIYCNIYPQSLPASVDSTLSIPVFIRLKGNLITKQGPNKKWGQLSRAGLIETMIILALMENKVTALKPIRLPVGDEEIVDDV